MINLFITTLVYKGVKESRNFSNVMVILKLIIVALVIGVGAYYVDPGNWLPVNDAGVASFMPNGFSGVMTAVSGVFFAYIGFDAISVMAEESKNPQRDLPRSMILSLVICTVVYILLTLVLTGVLNYRMFEGVGDPLAKIFEVKNVGWMQAFVSVAAVIAMTSVLLVFQMGQPRIWMSMSRDGLLPPAFQRIHPKYKTPSFSTIITGLLVGVPILFTDKSFVLDFTSIATLFAFVLVCGGILLIPKKEKVAGKFNMPYVNSKYIFPLLVMSAVVIIKLANKDYFSALVNVTEDNASLNISTIILWIVLIILSIFSYIKSFSLIPLLGLSCCLYLLTGMTGSNWAWFGSWLALGLIFYFSYGYKKSKLVPAVQ
jgi:basic amino acid/polyamine antiporter, APA family